MSPLSPSVAENLAQEFAINPDADWVRRHNIEARRVVDSWRADRPIRVPVLMDDSYFQHGILSYREDLDYLRYFSDPDEMVRMQLEAARLRRELPIADVVLGEAPESWPVGVDFHPVVAPGWIGCPLFPRRDTVIAHQPRGLSREECELEAQPDPRSGGILAKVADFRQTMAERHEGRTLFLGRPVGPVRATVGHYGVFAMGLDLRGQDLLLDILDDPAFAARFLLKMAEWCDALEQAWAAPGKLGYFNNTDHGIDLLSAETYEALIVPVIEEMNRRRGTGLPTGIHHCGRGAHLFPTIKRRFPLQRIDDIGFPSNDIAALRRAVGEEVRVKVEIDAGIVQTGPAERIRHTVRDLMTSGAKGRGRLAVVVGDLLPGTPLEHRLVLYEAVKEYGGY